VVKRADARTEAVTPPELVDKLLRSAGEDAVLVGGQALGFWLQRYELALPEGVGAISADTDFLVKANNRGAVERFARVIGGKPWYPNERALTSLVGMAWFDVSDDEFINVDVIHDVVGIDAGAVRARAVGAQLGMDTFLVMHPLDVLHSRLANLYKLAEKQNPKGVMQLSLAIDVAREFLRQEAARLGPAAVARRSPVQRYVTAVEQMAVEDAGRKVAARFGLHVADAIDPSVIPAGPFWTKRWPALRELMSPAYAGRFQRPA
jgi:hypothetical protein